MINTLNADRQEQAKLQLETLIDQASLHKVVELLAEVCNDKAVHIETNWQDDRLARVWRAASAQLESLEQKIYKAGL